MNSQPIPEKTDHEQRLAAGRACLEAALQVYLPHGLSVTCCCDPHHIGVYKKHGKDCHSPGKSPMHLWKHRQGDIATRAEIEQQWRRYPIGNVGCVLGQVSGVVRVDVDGAPGEAAVQEWSQGDLPPTWEFRSSPGGRGLLYRWSKDQPCHTVVKSSPDGQHAELRLMGNGSQTVLPPSRHESGSVYTWVPGHSPDDLPLAPAPAWLVERMTVVPRPAIPAAVPMDTPSADYATEVLRWIPNPGADRETWLKMGMALHSTGAPWAFDVWDAWSQQYPEKYSASEQVKAWESLSVAGPAGKAPITFGTLVHLARANGYQRRHGGTPGPEPPDPSACPELPDYARTNEDSAADASLFLDDYITISRTWAPRAYEGFHEAVALFLLATIAARRIKILFGPRGTYTSLYIALAARTTMHTKSTAVDVGLALLDAAELSWLLADDDSTPQAFLRSLSLYVPSNYAEMPREEQDHIRRQLAFAGQRGWFYEEWGQHLEAMMQKNGYMAGFRGILKRLDDHKARFASNTIARGREILHKPYVSLLANVTPSDLHPFVKAHSPLWRDGYIARMAFVAPDQDEGSEAEFPQGSLSFPGYLVSTLKNWHRRLGIPSCTLTPLTDKKGQPTGAYLPAVTPLPEKVYTMSPEVWTAYYAYDRAMRALTRQRRNEDLDGNYGRFPGKALRIAGLLASLHDDSDSYTIWPRQWWRGQQIVERWRQGVHRLITHVSEGETETRADKGEQRVLAILRKHGALSVRDIHRWSKLPHADILQHLVVLGEAGVVNVTETPRAKKYSYVLDGEREE